MPNATQARWKLVLGSAADAADAVPLPPDYGRMDDVLTALCDGDKAARQADLGASAPRVSRWLLARCWRRWPPSKPTWWFSVRRWST